MKRIVACTLCLVIACVLGCRKSPEPEPEVPAVEQQRQWKLAFITNTAASFWRYAHAGIEKAEAELGVKVTFLMPPNSTVEEQTQYLENLIAQKYDAVAISAIDAENMVPLLDKVAGYMALFCHDSDAPGSKRLAYLGTNNHFAGTVLGKRLVKLLPDGGKIAIFVGRLDAQNARERWQGIMDTIKDSGIPIELVDTKLDEADRARAKQNVEDVIASVPDVDVLIGLWAYNGPMIASALKGVGKQGQIQALCFDEDRETLQAIKEGIIESTVVQQPFEFGYQGVKLMVDYLERGDVALPGGGKLDIPVLVIDADKVDEFAAKMEAMLNGA